MLNQEEWESGESPEAGTEGEGAETGRLKVIEILVVAGGILTCAILAVISVIRSEPFHKLTQNTRWDQHSELVHASLDEVRSEAAAAESAERGFALTGDAHYIEEYQAALASVDRQVRRVRKLTSDNPLQQRRLSALLQLFAKKRVRMGQSIRAVEAVQRYKPKSGAAAGKYSLPNDGQELNPRLNAQIEAIWAEERRLMVQRNAVAEETNKKTTRFSILVTLLAIGLPGVEGIILVWYIRKRAQVEKAIEYERDLLRILMDNVPDTIHFKDLEGRFLRVNRAQAEVLGLESAAQAVGKTEFDFAPPAHAQRVHEEDREIIQTGKPLFGKVEQMKRPDGIPGWGLSAKIPITGTDGRVCGLVGVTRDITRIKEWEDDLEAANTELEEKVKERTEELRILNESLERRVAERTAQLSAANKELEAFSYSVSHDLRAPLRQIAGFAKILVEEHGSGLDDKARHYLERVEDGTKRMGKLADALLSLGRVGRASLSIRTTQLGEMVQRVIDDMRMKTDGRQIEWRVNPLPVADCDPILTRQVFVNLLSNAVKFTKLKPKAVIEVGESGHPPETAIYVRDNGAGFDMKYVNKLFGVFQRLHRAEDFEGIGIGLATVHSIVGKHGGRVWADSEPGRGTTIYFTLGRSNTNPDARGCEPLEEHDEHTGNRNIAG